MFLLFAIILLVKELLIYCYNYDKSVDFTNSAFCFLFVLYVKIEHLADFLTFNIVNLFTVDCCISNYIFVVNSLNRRARLAERQRPQLATPTTGVRSSVPTWL